MRHSYLRSSLALVCLFFWRVGVAGNLWDIDDYYFGAAIADAQWTIDESFPGTKLIVEGAYSFDRSSVPIPRRSDCDCVPRGSRDRMLGSVWGHLQWGQGETKLEYGVIGFGAIAYQTDYDPADERFQPLTDTLEWGVLRFGKDDPLGIDSYSELAVMEMARIWQYRHSESSPWYANVGLNLSLGYAWAESTNETYQEVSNPIVGTWWRGTIGRRAWGEIYLEQRVINGFTASSPARGGSVSREAAARFGYVHRLDNCLEFEIFSEKRSFNFSDPNLTDLYTKSKRTGIALSCRI